MTGRRLYDKYTDALRASQYGWGGATVLPTADNPPLAWSFLANRDQNVWNDLARRITPRKRAA